MIHHAKYRDYVAVRHETLSTRDRLRVLGPVADAACFDCPDRNPCWSSEHADFCPISGVWMHVSTVAVLRLAGVSVELEQQGQAQGPQE